MSPFIAGMPPYALGMLGLICLFISGVGAFYLRRRRANRNHTSPNRRGIPLSVIAALVGPLLGVVIAVIEGLANRTEEYPYGQWDYFGGIIFVSAVVGIIVAFVLAIVVDLPSFSTQTNKPDE